EGFPDLGKQAGHPRIVARRVGPAPGSRAGLATSHTSTKDLCDIVGRPSGGLSRMPRRSASDFADIPGDFPQVYRRPRRGRRMTSRRSAGDLGDIADDLADPVGDLRKVADGLREVFQAPKRPKTGLQTCKSRPEAASAMLRMTRGQAGSSTGVGVGAGVGDSAL